MKKYLLPYFTVFAFLLGCAAFKPPVKKVEGNTFYCSSPKLEVEVSQELQFDGEEKMREDFEGRDYQRPGTAFYKAFTFRGTSNLLAISVVKLPMNWQYITPSFDGTEDPLYFGKQKLGSHNYYYFTSEEGPYIQRSYVRNARTDTVQIRIFYMEERDTELASEREQLILFDKNSRNAFRVDGQKLPKRELEEERLKTAYIPKANVRGSLRTEPKKLLERDIRKMLARYGFYDGDLNWQGSFANDFVDNGDGTITDRATGLMWQKSGSSRAKLWKRARTYVKQLNKGQFAGYSDWRLPTIEEFASLVEREKVNGVHIDPLFYDKQEMCWSSDKADPFGGHTRNPPQIWIINFPKGKITTAILLSEVVPSKYSTSEYNYVRAVRGVK
jgi:hypothetical protein